jgi:hypothetical protein
VIEADVRRQLFRFIRVDLDEEPITQTDATRCPRCGALVKPPIGRPDILVSPAFVVEVKTLRAGETSFPFDRVEPEQRRWLSWFLDERNKPAFLGLGIIRKHGKIERLDHLYLIPWDKFLEVERKVCEHQSSIPLEAGPGYKRELQDSGLDILTQFKSFELTRRKGKWHLPKSSQLRRRS